MTKDYFTRQVHDEGNKFIFRLQELALQSGLSYEEVVEVIADELRKLGMSFVIADKLTKK